MFDTVSMLSVYDIEGFRRSAAMAPLSKEETFRILDECARMIDERSRMAGVLADLPASFGAVRAALNELQVLVNS